MKCPQQKKQIIDSKNIFKTIFIDHWDKFKAQKPKYAIDQYEEPVEKMLGCGETFSGYSEHICMHCGRDNIVVPFSCKSCFCLSCSKKYTDDFVSQVSQYLHAGVIYRHIVLTLPEQLRVPFYKNRFNDNLLSALMKKGYECLEDVVSTVKRKSLKIGCIVVVQTHGRSGSYNPHLHIIMTSGGVQEDLDEWSELGYFKYEIIHKKWQYHLLNMVKTFFETKEIDSLVDELWKKYPKGFVANVSKGEVPESYNGLARYLAKYVASPPIAVGRILNYDGETVKYWYKDHQTKSKKVETIDVYTFIGRMVQHIMPKSFQRVRYYGLQATKTFKKWVDVIKAGIKKIGRLVKGAYQVVRPKKYRERYKEISGKDPMICRYCGHEMELLSIWHPKYGILYDAFEELKAGKYGEIELKPEEGREGRCAVRPPSGNVQLPLFAV